MSRVCSAGQPTSQQFIHPFVLHGKNFNITHKLLTRLFHACHAYSHHWLLTFCTTFTDLDLGWLSQGQRKAKPLSFIFTHIFQLIRMKFDVVLTQFQVLKKSRSYFWMSVNVTKALDTGVQTASKNFNIGMHSDIYESIWLTLGNMIYTVELYIWY